MRILVTGGAGFIASHVADAYIQAGHEVAIVDNLWTEGGGKEANLPVAARFYRVDVTDQEKLARVYDEFQPEVINHHAAQHSVAISTSRPRLDAEVNVLGLINVLENAVRVNARKVIFSSSGATYGTPLSLPIDEATPQRPESPYGITKMVSEQYLRYWQEAYGLSYTAFRYGNVYGPRQDPHGEAGVIAIFARRFLVRAGVRIDWDGEQRKDYIYVEDVARANLKALDSGDNEIFCIAAGHPVSVNEIYQSLVRIFGYEVPVTRAPKRPGDIYNAFFDTGKAASLLGWKASVPFSEGILRTVQSFQS